MIKTSSKQWFRWLNGMSYAALNLAQANLHSDLRENQELRYRARMLLLLAYFFNAFLFCFFLLVLMMPFPLETKIVISFLWLYQVSMHSTCAYFLQVRGSYSFAAHLMLVALSSLYFMDIALTGGPVHSALTEVFYLLPIVAFFLLGMRGGSIWTGGLFITLCLFFYLAFLEVPFVNIVSDDMREVITVMCFVSGFIFIFFMILIYENTFLGLQYQQQKSESQTRYLATHDQLTGIANRTHFYKKLDESILNHKKINQRFAFIYMDLVGFKEVNDVHGHHAGDVVLKRIASRLDEGVRGTDLVARHGGDEFVFILNNVKDEEAVQGIADKIAIMVSEPIQIHDIKLQVFPSMGVALFPEHANDSIMLERLADQAMYQAKVKKCSWQIHQGACSKARDSFS